MKRLVLVYRGDGNLLKDRRIYIPKPVEDLNSDQLSQALDYLKTLGVVSPNHQPDEAYYYESIRDVKVDLINE